MQELHLHFHMPEGQASLLLADRQLLHEVLNILKQMEIKLATIDDLNNAVAGIQGNLTANDARVANLANAVSSAASSSAARDNDLMAQIQALKDQIAAGGDPAALQPAVDKLVAMATEAQAEGAALDSATSALAAAFPAPAAPAQPPADQQPAAPVDPAQAPQPDAPAAPTA